MYGTRGLNSRENTLGMIDFCATLRRKWRCNSFNSSYTIITCNLDIVVLELLLNFVKILLRIILEWLKWSHFAFRSNFEVMSNTNVPNTFSIYLTVQILSSLIFSTRKLKWNTVTFWSLCQWKHKVIFLNDFIIYKNIGHRSLAIYKHYFTILYLIRHFNDL